MKRYNYEFGKTDNGVLSNVSGYATETNNFGESAFGVLNKSTLDEDNFTTQSVVTSSKATIFSVGNGDSIENRKNIIELKANGDTYVVNVGGYDGTNAEDSKNLEEEFTGIHEDIRELNEDVDRIDNTIASIHIDNVNNNELVYELLIDGENRGTINIPKDQFLKDVDYDGGSKELIFTFSVRVEGDPLQTEDKIVRVDIANLVDTYSAGDGLNLVDHQFSVKVDPASDSHLSVSSNGLKLTSFDDAYATKEELEEFLPLAGGTLSGLLTTSDSIRVGMDSNIPKGYITFVNGLYNLPELTLGFGGNCTDSKTYPYGKENEDIIHVGFNRNNSTLKYRVSNYTGGFHTNLIHLSSAEDNILPRMMYGWNSNNSDSKYPTFNGLALLNRDYWITGFTQGMNLNNYYTVYDCNGVTIPNKSNTDLLHAAGGTVSIQDIISQISIPTKVSELTNDSGFQTEAQVAAKVSALVDSAPETLDTLNELAAALGNDPNFATTVANQIGTKLSTSVYSADKATFALKTEIPDVSKFITDTEVSNIYLTKTDASNTYQPKGNYLSLSGGTLTGTLAAKNIELGPANKIRLDSGVEYDSDHVSVGDIVSNIANPFLEVMMGTNDTFSILAGGDVDKGYIILSSWDNGTEPIYIAQINAYNSTETNPYVKNLITLMDPSGNQIFNEISTTGVTIPNKTSGDILTADGNTTKLKTINSQSITGSGDIQIPQPTVKAASGTLTLWTGTQALYDSITDKSYETLYFVVDPSEKAYGVEWSGTQSTLTRIGNMEYHKTLPIQSKMKGCVHKNGVIQYYLDPEDWTKKADGTTSKLDGTDGEVGVEVPKFYIWEEKVDDTYRVWISEERICSQAEESPRCIVSAFRCTYDNTASTPKLISIANTDTKYRGGNRDAQYDQYLDSDPIKSLLGKPATSMTRSTARTYARNNGCELLSYTQYKNIFYWLYVIEYANFNSQATFNSSLTSDGYRQGGLGSGVTTYSWDAWDEYNGYNPLTPNGYLNEFGNGTGTKSFIIPETGDYSTYTLSSIKWRGFENPFGDIHTNLDGIIFDRTDTTTSANITAHIITNPSKYSDVINAADDDRRFTFNYPTNTYIAEFVDSVNADIIPMSSGGGATSGKCDYCWSQQDNGNTTFPNCLLVGGAAADGTGSGLASFHCRAGVANSYQYVGFRTIKILE